MIRIGGTSTGMTAARMGPEMLDPRAASGFARQLGGITEGTRPAGVAAASGNLANLGLLALQETRPTPSARRRAVARAAAILDDLDELRGVLLEGGAPAEVAARLQSLVRTELQRGNDEQLETILDAIDLRAQVELAKLEVQGCGAASSKAWP